ncbi:MAG: cytochrome c oxidase subunit I [Streptosporangiaceae bacterium]
MATTEVEVPGIRPELPRRRPVWVEWLTTTDHKKIGTMYMVTAFCFFLVGGVLAMVIRTNLLIPSGALGNFSTYNQMFSMHGTVMIFLFVMPITVGISNYVVPLMIGAADMAFPRVNAFSYWTFPLGGTIIMCGFFSPQGAAQAGWTSYPPLSERTLVGSSPGFGEDVWIIGLIVVGIGSLLGAINLLVTMFKMRAPGMTLYRMPIFCWTSMVTSLLLVLALPTFTSALVALYVDRNWGGHFFDPSVGGGGVILYQNIFWFFAHPEVYILILPSMGIVSEVIPVFSRKPLFGYRAFIWATLAIGTLSFGVWSHHMFVTGATYSPFFTVMTAAIAVPTGVKFFNWTATMWGGRIRMTTAMYFAIGFLLMFLIGGVDGVFLGSPPVDFQLHATYWVVAHIHYVLFGGAAMGILCGFYFWWPKWSGRFLDERLGKIHFWLWFIGGNLAFMPMHIDGLLGMPRRVASYLPRFQMLNDLSTVGAYLLGIGAIVFVINVLITARKPRTAPNDPWEANSLEWATTSPPPPWNFDSVPRIRSERPVYDMRMAAAAASGHAASASLDDPPDDPPVDPPFGSGPSAGSEA